MKRILAALLIAAMLFGMTACITNAGTQPEKPKPKVVMVASRGGLGDQSFNDMAYQGIERAQQDFDIEVEVIEPETEYAYITSLSQAAEEGAALIIAAGYVEKDQMLEIAQQFPDTLFAVVDSDDEIGGNVMSLSFKEQEGSFLMGAIAALTTQTDIVGFVGSIEGPAMERFEYGFRAGVKAINPNAQVLVNYTDSIDRSPIGRLTAISQADRGADVIYHASGQCGAGVIEAAGEKGFWTIGMEQDQSAADTGHMLCSMFKRVDNAVYLAIQSMAEEDFEGGVYEFGLDFEAVGYTDNAGNLPMTVAKQADAYAAAIAAGDLYVPANRADFEDFQVPEGGLVLQQN